MKLAKIIPLFKKGNRCDAVNYHPISILSVACMGIEVRFLKFMIFS